ncbi:hypothetical protein ACJ5NV_18130 [Loktanella agnita]|uniref:hypothetical protein n=1 Tax=Loktanella agnita TaxID=287097 RepID=UPI0039899394
MKAINLAEKLSLLDTHWDPKAAATRNDIDVMVVTFHGAPNSGDADHTAAAHNMI